MSDLVFVYEEEPRWPDRLPVIVTDDDGTPMGMQYAYQVSDSEVAE